MTEMVLLKLGGSLITDKDKPYTPRLDKLKSLAAEIKSVLDLNPNLLLILGHGSGSFGHVAAKKYGTREGVKPSLSKDKGEEYWKGFTQVRYQAAELNRYVLQALISAGISAIPFPPSTSIVSNHRIVVAHNSLAIRKALEAHILPVVHGDVVFDETLGGTILSTEDVFIHFAEEFSATRILLAGIEAGVWEDFPARTKLVQQIQPSDYEKLQSRIGGSISSDVTGGMKSKVEAMLALILERKGLTVQIFSAEQEGFLTRALIGENLGTLLTSD